MQELPRVSLKDWLERLERNEDPQGFENLWDSRRCAPCALGVAALMAGAQPKGNELYLGEEYITNAQAGMILAGDSYSIDLAICEVVSWNDSEHLSFPEIAQRFREQYGHLLEAQA